MKKIWIIALCLSSVLLTGCATHNTLNHGQILESYPSLRSLDQNFQQANAGKVKILSPETYEKSKDLLDEAMGYGKKNQPETEIVELKGITTFEKAEKNAANAEKILRDTLEKRNLALQANADTLFKEQFQETEEDLIETSSLIEKGSVEAAKKSRVALERRYRELELKALKKGTVQRAQALIKAAKKADADDLAPTTFGKAELELKLAEAVLQSSKSNTDKANEHAEISAYYAEKSIQISEMAKDFKRRDFNEEDYILWYHEQLDSALKPANIDLPFNQENNIVIGAANEALQTAIATREQQALTAQEKLAVTERSLKSELDIYKSRTEQLEQAKELRLAKLKFIQGLFSEKEADVLMSGENVLIRAHGFKFPSGKSIIESSNFSMLQKIVSALNKYPSSTVTISGHTDSQGNDVKNMELSQARAKEVEKFLAEVGGVNSSRLRSKGLGESKPLATNDTAEGRAANRRVEILINEKQTN